jgi:hypothetical protein
MIIISELLLLYSGFDIDCFLVGNKRTGERERVTEKKKWREEPAGRLDEFTSSWPLSHHRL